VRSDTAFRSRSFSFSNSFSRFTWFVFRPPLEFPRFRRHPLTEVERCSDATNKESVPDGFPGADRRIAWSRAER
jgi:hypothetical protein